MRLELVRIGHPVLRKKTEPVSEKLIKDSKFQTFLNDMVVTMHEAQGVGLAANQVGHDIQAVCLECKSNTRYPDEEDVPLQIYLNPRILEYSEEKEDDWEGCLSIPGYRGLVPRAKEVTFEALTQEGKKVKKKISG